MEDFDAIVVGGNMRGLVAAYVLGSLGCRTLLVEKGKSVGGADGSFRTAQGTRFDFGFHVLDYMRSAVATRLFMRVVDGEAHRTTLRRAIVLRNHVIPYAPSRAELPPEIEALLAPGELHDDIGDAPPTRERLARCYGRGFADLVLDEVLPSYPSENRHRAFGVDESQLLANIYPWFFPRARRPASADESRRFHDRLRAGIAQDVLYPREGGFAGFALGFQRALAGLGVEVLLGADVELVRASGTHTITEARVGGRRLRAEHYFWAAPWGALCKLLDIPCQDTATDRVLLGSFRLDRPAASDYHEILVGDPRLQINRIYFPARFRASDEPLMQVEFAVPLRENWPGTAAHWGERWRADLERLGILRADHRVEEFDFKSIVMHFNGYGMEGERLRDADPALVRPDSNVRPVVPSMANLNLNRYVPRTVAYVASVLGAADAAR